MCWPMCSKRLLSPASKTPSLQAHWFLQMSTACMPVCGHGATTISVSTTDEANSHAMKMATVCVKSMEIRWKAFGRCCAAGVVRIGAFPKRNSRSTSGSSSLYTTSASEARRCCLHSLSYWSRKPPESNKSVFHLSRGRTRRQPAVGVPGHALEDVGRMATQEDRWMGFLRRWGIAIPRWEVVVAAVESALILRPQLLQRHDRLSGLGPTVVEVAAHHRGLLPVPTSPNPEEKPAVAVEVQHCNRFGEQQ